MITPHPGPGHRLPDRLVIECSYFILKTYRAYHRAVNGRFYDPTTLKVFEVDWTDGLRADRISPLHRFHRIEECIDN